MKTISVMQNFENFTSHEPCLRKLLKEISTNTGNKPSKNKKKKRGGMKLRKQGSNPRERQRKCPRWYGRDIQGCQLCCSVRVIPVVGKRVIPSRKITLLGKNESERLVWYLVHVNWPWIISISEKVRRWINNRHTGNYIKLKGNYQLQDEEKVIQNRNRVNVSILYGVIVNTIYIVIILNNWTELNTK